VNYQNIIAEKENSIMSITLNRPDKLNAIDATMLDELTQALQDANEDERSRWSFSPALGALLALGLM